MWLDMVRKINRNVKTGKTCPGLKIYSIYLKAHFSNLIYIYMVLHTIWALVRLGI
jgi:hypothetical protein